MKDVRIAKSYYAEDVIFFYNSKRNYWLNGKKHVFDIDIGTSPIS